MQGKVIVITGASAGIGEALAHACSTRGAKVALIARRIPELTAVAASCGEAEVIVADVTVRAEVEAAAAAAIARFGNVDVWVNNAGRGISRKASELTDDDLDDMMKVNVKSALYGVQAILPHFRARGGGHIINVSSMLGRVPFAGIRAAYSASKHALNSLSANLRMELAPENILVSVVSPGVVATEFGSNALHGGFDSRSFPGAQSAVEVAAVIADLIDAPRADVYTRPGAHDLVASYYAAADLGAAERQPPFLMPPR
jgi:NADP-dependent 3-hydroxy acid dehydrogenase YdfG